MELLGHNVMNAFLDSVFAAASQEVKDAINELRRGNGWDLRTATEEYLAGLAERTDCERMTEEERDLFATIRSATKSSLQRVFESGMISKETYDNVSSMYQYYIPLRMKFTVDLRCSA